MSDAKRDLLEKDDRGWAGFRALIDGLTPEQMDETGYYEDWSVKDLIAHVGSWFAEAAMMLEQMRMGTYSIERLDVDGLNRQWFETWRDKDLSTVKTELMAARARMLEEWDRLRDPDSEACRWFYESTAEHYEEHVPRLRDWAKQLGS
ncbi:MAG: maleylpyruvate isomerase N-terminal domain-containing protein [Actinomycetota bacterium]